MKKFTKKLFALLLVVALVMSFSVTAFAADSTITFEGRKEGFSFQPGSEYTATDLFDNFKDVMPGDRLTETIQIKNIATDCDYVKLYMRAVVHDENGNPLTYSEAFENADGKDQTNIDGQRDETVASMQDFLSQLTMRIYNGDELIYNASPDEAGALVNNVLLGTLSKGESLNLKVELDVPINLGNEYANRVGEVDWVFLMEGFNYETLTVQKIWDDNNDPNRPESVKVQLLRNGKEAGKATLNAENQWTYTWNGLNERYTWTVEEVVPEGYEVTYETRGNVTWITNTKVAEPTEPSTEPSNPTDPSEEPSNPPTEPSEEPSEPSNPPTEPSEEPTEPSNPPTEPSEEPTEPSNPPTEPSKEPSEPSNPPTEPSEEPSEPSNPPTEPIAEPVDLTVKKVWSGDKEANRPDSVIVTLYNGSTAVEKVTLSAKNNWTYTWEDLDGNGNWSVLESSIPNGYTPSYKTSGDTVTITNTASLIKTGQTNWPILALGGLGLVLILCGVYVMTRKRKNHA